MKADVILSQGSPKRALRFYQKALQAYKKDISIYQQIAICYTEVSKLSLTEWKLFKQEVTDAVKTVANETVVDEISQTLYGPGAVSYAFYLISEALQNYREAWSYLFQANKLSTNLAVVHDVISQRQSIAKAVMRIFTKDFFSSVDFKTVNPTFYPVFIVGMPRSGSTLLESILFSHSSIFTIGEESVLTPNLNIFVNDVFEKLPRSAEDDDDDGTESTHFYDRFQQGIITLHKEKSLKGLLLQHSTSNFNEMISVAQAYLGKTSKKHQMIQQMSRIVDKNLNNILNIGLIHLLFPNAVVIHTTRDPVETIYSCFKHRFTDVRMQWTNDIQSLYDEYGIYFEVMHHFKDVLPHVIYDVNYEELVRTPENIVRGLLDRISVSWEPSVLHHHLINRTVTTNSFLQVRSPITSNFIGKSKFYYPALKNTIEKLKTLIDARTRPKDL